jgi:hypothetical protein
VLSAETGTRGEEDYKLPSVCHLPASTYCDTRHVATAGAVHLSEDDSVAGRAADIPIPAARADVQLCVTAHLVVMKSQLLPARVRCR